MDKQTDRQTDRQTETETEPGLIPKQSTTYYTTTYALHPVFDILRLCFVLNLLLVFADVTECIVYMFRAMTL